MKKKYLLIIALFLSLSGCGSGGGISTTALTSILNDTEAVGDDIVEASVAKEAIVHKTLQSRDIEYGKAYKNSGFNIKFEKVTIAGVVMYLPSEISYKPEPNFETELPTEPSKHPVWNTITELGSVLAKYGLIGYGIHELSGAWEASVAGAQGVTYNGPVQGSFNAAGNDQSLSIMRDYAPVTNTATSTYSGF